MRYLSTNSTRRRLISLIILIFLGLAVRVVMPAGYMPAPIGEGGPFALCPDGMSGASLILAARSHGGEHAGGHSHDAEERSHFWEFCPFGAAFASVIIVNDLELVPSEFGQITVPTRQQLPARITTAYGFHPRAPPTLTSRSV